MQGEAGMRDTSVTGVQACALLIQAEDGIRDTSVTGVQTCALPIYGDFVDTGAQGFFDYDAEDRLFDAIAVDEGLQREAPLAGSGGRDHRLTDFHVGSGPLDIMPVEAQNRTWIAMPASKYYLSG